MGRAGQSLLLLLSLSACSSPTQPSPSASNSPVVVAQPPVVTPAPGTPPAPAPNPLISDPRFSLAFYRLFALGTLEYPIQPLRRQTQAPRVYVRTVDDNGAPIDPLSLDQTAAAIINTTGKLTGVFGLAGLEQGTGTRQGQTGWITVRWSTEPSPYCGVGLFGGDTITLYPRTPGCRCAGGPIVRLRTVKHELGHTLGFYHTDSPNDLMSTNSPLCDQEPSEREIYHARVAYSMPVGSLDPF